MGMWDVINDVLTGGNAFLVLVFLVVFTLLFILMARTGLLQIHTDSFRMGSDVRERDIIRQQTEWSHSYLMGLESKIVVDKSQYNGYLTKYILETIYDEVINWITFNHINLESDYINIKQEKVKSIVRGYDIAPEYHSEKFERQIDRWTEEIIKKLVQIREIYK